MSKLTNMFCLPFLLGGILAQTVMGADLKLVQSGLAAPTGIAIDKDGALYIAEWGADRIVKLVNGKKQLVAEGIASPASILVGKTGELYASGYGDGNLYRLEEGKAPQILASGFSAPTGLAWSKDEQILLANRNAGEVVRIAPDGKMELVSRNHQLPVGLARSGDGSLYISCYGGMVDVLEPGGGRFSIKEGFARPGVGIVAGPKNDVLVVDYGAGAIRRIDRNGKVSSVASGLKSPVALARRDNVLFVGIWGDGCIWQVGLEDGHE